MRTEREPPACWGRFVLRKAALCAALALAAGLPVCAQESRAVARVAFAHGVVAFHHERYEEAAGLFEEAVRNDPAEGTYLHWLAIAHLRKGRGTNAVARLEQSLAAERPPVSGRRRVRSELRRVRKSLERGVGLPDIPEPAGLLKIRFPGDPPRWEGEIALESAYDSNPGLLAEDLDIPVSGVALGDVPGDAAALLGFRIDHLPVWDRGGWTLGWNVQGHQSMHPDLAETDLSLARGTASLAWGHDPGGIAAGPLGNVRVPAGRGLTFLLQGGGLYGRLGNEDFLTSWEAAASVIARQAARTETRLAAVLRGRDYSGGAGGALRRGNEDEASVAADQLFFFGRRDRYLRLGAAYGISEADRSFAASFIEASAEAAAPLSGRWALSLFGALRKDEYEHPESNVGDPFGPPRDDTTWRAGAAALWKSTDHLFWTARGTYVRRDSNVELLPGSPLLDYERTILSLGLRWIF